MRYLLFICLCVSVSAADFYVATDGDAGNPGTLAEPLTLQAALTSVTIDDGDTVWVRVGTYSGDFTSNINSSSGESPIIFRNYNKERAIIDGRLTLNNSTSSNIWFWGLEIIDSLKATRSDPFDTISNGGPGVKFINCLIHDTCIALAGGPYEAYGNIMWFNGKVSTEHGIYWQNVGTIPKIMEDNLIGWASGFGIHCFSSGGLLNNLQAIGNVIWESGQTKNDRKANILIGGGTSITNSLIDNNDLFMMGARGMEVGYSISDNHSIRVSNNRSFGRRPFAIPQSFDAMTVTNNTIMHIDDGVVYVVDPTPFEGTYDWDFNTYFGARAGHNFKTNTVDLTFDQWKTTFGFDANSTYTQTPTNNFINQVLVRTNKYEAKRAHIAVWNFAQAPNVSADISEVLSVGDTYEVRSAMNYLAGPILSGTYSGGNLLLPMTNLTCATPLYWTPTQQPQNITTNFGAFVLIGEAAQSGQSISRATNLNVGTLRGR